MVLGRALAIFAVSLTLLGFGRSEAAAETKVPSPASAGGNDRPAQPAQADSAKDGVRRDPKGQKGIGPFWEALHRGDDHALARDYPKAKEAYQAALALTPKQAIAHYRIGQIEVLSGNLPEAETAYTDALRFVDNAPELHAQLLFVLADLKERMGQRDAAIKAWQAYLDYLKSEAKAKGYRATADDRLKRILRYNELLVECKGVKERVQLRVKELEENAKRKAK